MSSTIYSVQSLYGLIGYPLIHSFSQDYYNRKFESEGINAMYLNFEIEDIGQFMEIVAQYPNLKGLNVTAPYKEQVIPYLNELDEDAQVIGAVNVLKVLKDLKNNDVRLKGYNSDVVGFSKSIEPFLDENHNKAMVLGTGGAAKAVSHALQKLGVEVMHISRNKTQATVTYEEITKAMVHDHKIIVNATPLGTYPHVESCPDFPYRFLTQDHIAYDLVYNPEETLFMKKSKEFGATVKNGLEMWLLQGFASYEIWTNDSL